MVQRARTGRADGFTQQSEKTRADCRNASSVRPWEYSCDEAAKRSGQLIGADERQALVQLRRDITRPAPTIERVQRNAAEQTVLKLKTP